MVIPENENNFLTINNARYYPFASFTSEHAHGHQQSETLYKSLKYFKSQKL